MNADRAARATPALRSPRRLALHRGRLVGPPQRSRVSTLLAAASLLAAGLAVIVLWHGTAVTSGDGPAAVVREIDRAFDVAEVRIARGQSIRFFNADEFLHELHVLSPGFQADAKAQLPGQPAIMVFDRAGRFLVRCRIHPTMQLRVDVAGNG